MENITQFNFQQNIADDISEISLGSFDDSSEFYCQEPQYYREDQGEYQVEYLESESAILAKTTGDALREQAIKRILANPEAYENLPFGECPKIDMDAEDFNERWNAFVRDSYEVAMKERDMFLANGGLTNDEFKYLRRRSIATPTHQIEEDAIHLEIEEIEE